MLHVPPLRRESRALVLAAERQRRGAVDGDVVVVVEVDELPEPELSRDRRRLVGDALHQVAVRADRIDVVVDDLVVRAVVALGEEPLRDGEADAVGEALAERTGRRLDPRRVMHLRVTRRERLPLAEALQLLEREVVAGQVQRRVLEDARVPGREDEAIAVRPLRIRRIDLHHLAVEEVRQRSERHRRAGMARVRLLHRIHRQRADGVDGQLFDVSLRHGAPRRAAAASPEPNDIRPRGLRGAANAFPSGAAAAWYPSRSRVVTAAPRSEASSTPDATTGRPSASAMIWIQSGSLSRPPPVATISSSPGRRSAIAAMRNATPSSAAWRRSSGVVAKVRPVTVPLAAGSQPVERSPPRNGRNVRPWSSGPRPAREPAGAASVRPSQSSRLPPSESAPPSTKRRSSAR